MLGGQAVVPMNMKADAVTEVTVGAQANGHNGAGNPAIGCSQGFAHPVAYVTRVRFGVWPQAKATAKHGPLNRYLMMTGKPGHNGCQQRGEEQEEEDEEGDNGHAVRHGAAP